MTLAPDKAGTATALQDSLVELIDLSLQAKHYHWNVTGQDFRGVHLQLDEITDAVRLWYDDVAERLATLDVAPDGRLGTLAASSPLPVPGEGWQRDVDAFRGRGLAGLATRHVLAAAGAREPGRSYLGVFTGNEPAIRAYTRLGFATVGESPDMLLG